MGFIAGVDEVGRGPLAGPVVAAAVILPDKFDLVGLTDSKKLSPKKRSQLFLAIQEVAVAVGVGRAEPSEIDEMNILQASLLAMKRAVSQLVVTPSLVQVDGSHVLDIDIPCEAIVGGDLSVAHISAASIIAKVLRDREMLNMAKRFPGYGFERHKGYPTRDHLSAMANLGISAIHRKSFRPVKAALPVHEVSE